ncbi:hypothetical protein SNE40_019211 [Patella caerulea]|uniref:Fibronectin type III-like domain-containing protein n=1 Tax=Patella caerulea TaxID=87958 RepID=A0AAN8J6R1_PATCE
MFLLKTAVCIFLLVEWSVQDYPFRDVSLSWDARVDDLVGRLTLDEITLQMAKGGAGINGPAPAIPRLGIGPYQWDTECLHGDVGQNATSYPQSIGLAATWSSSLLYRMAEATATEVRATHNANIKNHSYVGHTGLSCFAPVINMMRDPRWGRNQETYGEDPYLSGMLSTAYVNGLQGDHPRYVRASAGCKHFDVHGGPENIPAARASFNSVVSTRDWRTTFLPAFRYCVEAGTFSLMCSYNSINGVPSCANKMLLTDILRNEWGFKGYVVSDETAIENIISRHHYVNNSVDAAAASVNAGCNLELAGRTEKNEVFMSITDAVKQGKLAEDLVRERVKPLFYTRMRLGEFDPPDMNPYNYINTSVIEEQAHRDLAVEAAMKSFVLLKNDGLLPLTQTIYNSVAIVGPFADAGYLLGGDYNAHPDPKFITTPRQGLASLGTKANYASGCKDTKCSTYDSNSIQTAVQGVDVVFVCLGLGTPVESEANDRPDLEYPGQQVQLLQDVVQFGGSAKIILITFNAGPVNITWADKTPNINAIIAAFYPGQSTGVALRKVLTSSNAQQFGRLPYTWFTSLTQVPAMTNYTMVSRTYRYFTGEPLYPFGYGMTYTAFNNMTMDYPDVINAGDVLPIKYTFQNGGSMVGDMVVQIYVSWTPLTRYNTSITTPKIQLVNFMRITTAPGEMGTFSCNITPQNMAVFTEDKGWVVQEGTIYLYGGGSQPNVRMPRTGYVGGGFRIKGTKVLGFY